MTGDDDNNNNNNDDDNDDDDDRWIGSLTQLRMRRENARNVPEQVGYVSASGDIV